MICQNGASEVEHSVCETPVMKMPDTVRQIRGSRRNFGDIYEILTFSHIGLVVDKSRKNGITYLHET